MTINGMIIIFSIIVITAIFIIDRFYRVKIDKLLILEKEKSIELKHNLEISSIESKIIETKKFISELERVKLSDDYYKELLRETKSKLFVLENRLTHLKSK
ncbi:hypothetical protein LJC06_02995 [Bacteroidales bacterium OttesenSCG-928-I14]|nr:hypothetical protein [Bacteroidales bacterium OttesenSCG-928-I14]